MAWRRRARTSGSAARSDRRRVTPSSRSSCAVSDAPRARVGSELSNSRTRNEVTSCEARASRALARACPTAAARATTSARSSVEATASVQRCRAANLPARYRTLSGRARIGRSAMCRRRSSASAATEGYRRSGSLRRAVRRIVSRSPRRARRRRWRDTPGREPAATAALGRGGSARAAGSPSSSPPGAENGLRPTSSS